MFLRYLVWLRMLGHSNAGDEYKNWKEYWYFPVMDLSLQDKSKSLHVLTVALQESIDRRYFQLIYGHAPKLFLHRSTRKFALEKARTAQLEKDNAVLQAQNDIRRAHAHTSQRRLGGLAIAQSKMAEKIEGMLKAQVLLLQQELINRFWKYIKGCYKTS